MWRAREAPARRGEACGRWVWIAGSIGPIGRPLAPLGTVKAGEARQAFAAQAKALAEGGVDLLIFETFSDLHELTEGVAAAKEVTGLTIIAQMTFTHEGKTLLGHTPHAIVARLGELGVAVIGANCSVGPRAWLEVMEKMVLVSRTPLSAMRTPGSLPTSTGGSCTSPHRSTWRTTLAR